MAHDYPRYWLDQKIKAGSYCQACMEPTAATHSVKIEITEKVTLDYFVCAKHVGMCRHTNRIKRFARDYMKKAMA